MKKSLLLIIIIGLCLVGCQRSSSIKVRNASIKDLNKRYNEDMEFVASYDDQFNASYDSFYLESKNPNSPVYGKLIYVKVENYKTDNYTIMDNYLAMKYEKQTEDYINEKVHKYFNNANVYYACEKKYLCNLSYLNEGLNSSTTFNEFLKNTNQFKSGLFAIVELKESEFYDRKLLDDLTNEIDINNSRFYYYVMKDEVFGTLNRDGFDSILYRDFSRIKYRGETYSKNDKKTVSIYRDDIVTQKYKEETQKYLMDIAKQYYSESKLESWGIYDAEESYDLGLDASFDEYLKNRDVSFSIHYKVRKSDYSKEKFEDIVNRIIDDGLEFYLSLYVIEDDEFEEKESSNSVISAYKRLNEDVIYKDNVK